MYEEPLVYRLRKRAEIRRQISTRKSVQEGKPDRIADLLEEAASELERCYKPDNLGTFLMMILVIVSFLTGNFIGFISK